jgi:hypothetical protein
MQIPTPEQAWAYLMDAAERNPGPWVEHSRVAAEAARAIAAHHPALDPKVAYVMGLLHDIGRREGRSDMRHVVDGYAFLHDKGMDDVARICLTHSFPVPDVRAAAGQWDCSAAERGFVQDYLSATEYTAYDRLIQLCDALALPSGCCLMEKRLVDVVLRYGPNDFTVAKWNAFFDIQREFDQALGRSIYCVLPGIVQGTFGCDPRC